MNEQRERHPLFFLSYAHDRPAGPSEHVVWFFTELDRLVGELAGLRTGVAAGFMDSDLEGNWNDELCHAVGSCDVFVALLSPRYFKSEWCGKEWFAFLQRNAAEGSSVERAIVPVTWVLWRGSAPAAIDKVQRFTVGRHRDRDRATASIYEEEGLFFMVDKADREDAKLVLWRLANYIMDMAERNRVVARTLRSDELQNSFEEGA